MRAGELAEGDARFQVALGHCYRELRLKSQALDHYTAAVELEPSCAQYWNFRGMAHHGLGHHEDACDDYTRAIEHDPNVAAFWSNRALSHYLLQAYREAIEDASKAIELKPKYALARKWRAESFVALEHWAEAIDDYTSLIELQPNDTGHLLERARARQATGDDKGAQEDFAAYLQPHDQAVAAQPDDWQAWNRRGVALTRLDRWQQASDDFQKATELAPDQLVVHQNLATAYIQQDRWQEAANALLTVVSLRGGEWRPQYELALCCLAAANLDGYRTTCARMVDESIPTEDAVEASFTAWTCALGSDALDDYTPPIAAIAKAATRSEDQPQYQTTLGALLYRAARYDEALEVLSALDPGYDADARSATSPAYALYFLAMAHQAVDQDKRAREVLARANAWADQALSDSKHPPLWNRRLTLELLRDETEGLFKESNQAAEEGERVSQQASEKEDHVIQPDSG
jgi:tetratricopeptide (TPR) repeat protein